MLPDINIFGKIISFYTLSALVGILVVLAFQQLYTKRKGYDEVFMLFILLFSSIGVFIGGHILYAITMNEYIRLFFLNINEIKNIKELFSWILTIFGGSVFYGGLLGGIFVAFLFIRKKKFDVDPYIGIGTICIPLFHTFGRIGCFLSGCCYGIESKFGFYFNYYNAPGCQGISRFPVQLVEAFFNFVIFIVLFKLFDREKVSGKMALIYYLLMYSIVRFSLEFLRGDLYRGFIGVFSTSQFISLLIFTITITIIVVRYYKNKNAEILSLSKE